jgi:glycosyltransferase involved in cell wall biosynthesis
MSVSNRPLVSVLTPVYNCAPFIGQCIESVCSQTYTNWEYTIVDNCSTDGTRAIAEKYAMQDKRIKVHANETFLDIIANHNKAFGLISPVSKYCKQVSGDDWILPQCLERMVEIAEKNASVGIVGSYQVSGGGDLWCLRTYGLPYGVSAFSGREIGRLQLLGKLDVLGNPTSNFYRSDIVRSSDAFFPNKTPEADLSACYKHLREVDFGFVHEIVSYERVHPHQITATSKRFNANLCSKLSDLTKYGSYYLTSSELEARKRELLDEYYRYLAVSAVNFREREFWQYHRTRLQEIGYPLSRMRLAKEIAKKAADLALNPKQTVERILRRITPAKAGKPGGQPDVKFGSS